MILIQEWSSKESAVLSKNLLKWHNKLRSRSPRLIEGQREKGISNNMNKKIRVGLLFGGRSAEHEVSISSAKNIAAAIDSSKFELVTIGISKKGSWYLTSSLNKISSLTEETMNENEFFPISFSFNQGQGQLFNSTTNEPIKIDIIFPIIHGTYGEDGCVQGFLKMLNIPFTGCSVLSSAAGMDKDIMKQIFTHSAIPNATYQLLRPWNKISFKNLTDKLGLPFFIKPANAGSSVGVHKIKTEEEFTAKLNDSFSYDTKVIAEKYIRGREIEISVIGFSSSPEVSEPGEIKPNHEFYSYDAKYIDQNGAAIFIPAQLATSVVTQVKNLAKKAYTTLNCTGFARIDFFVTDNGDVFINEINTLPGFTNISMYPKMWEASGITYTNLISKLINLGLEQFKVDHSLKTNWLADT
jgi:D-alanine-D-alanine ligase